MTMPSSDVLSIDEGARRRFEQAWESGRADSIEAFLPPSTDVLYLGTLEELIAIELEFAWKNCGPKSPSRLGANCVVRFASHLPLVEDYLSRFPGLRESAAFGRLVRQEFLTRLRHGDAPAIGEYRDRFPDLPNLDQLDALIPPSPPLLPLATGYEVGPEVGHGGMAVVYRARQCGLERAVAIKSLLPRLGHDAGPVARFLEEARITARLQHPGIPPVHDVGVLPDGRPFLAMKLIRGKTLDQLLKNRPDVTADRGRHLVVFEQVCQAVAYAHANGVIHRDLKPANVMVGDFGEVQVMDWGLARIVRSTAAEQPLPTAAPAGAYSHGLSSTLVPRYQETQTGTVIGTPAYMPPEQARGDIGAMTERSDVFGLGAILCVILTGHPPLTGADAAAMLEASQAGDLSAAVARLDACPADADLVALCKDCLAPDPSRRPANGRAVAQSVAAHQAAVEARGRKAETDRAAADAKAREQRKRWQVQMALMTAIVVIVVMMVAGAWLQEKQHSAQSAAAAAAYDAKATSARGRATDLLELATVLRAEQRYAAAGNAIQHAAELAEQFAPDLGPTMARAKSDLAFVVELDRIRTDRMTIAAADGGKAPGEYRRAFVAHGLDVVADPAAAADRVRSSAVRAEAIAALDDWAVLEPGQKVGAAVRACAAQADPAAVANPLRDPQVWSDPMGRKERTAAADVRALPPATLVSLAELLRAHGEDAAPLLRRAVAVHPRDFHLFVAFADALTAGDGERIGAYRAARAIRPDNTGVLNNLGLALAGRQDYDGAVAIYREAVRLDPKHADAFQNLGAAYLAMGRHQDALAATRTSIAVGPGRADAHALLGLILQQTGDLVGARSALAEAVRLDPRRLKAVPPPREVAP